MTIIDLNRAFATEEKCREYISRMRWPHGVACPRCHAKTVSTLRNQGKYECSKCFYQFTITAGTIFHDSRLPLEKWFLAAYLMCESRKGVSANQLKRVLGVSYKTAWFLCHRIRAAMHIADTPTLNGAIEMDETYVGGRSRKNRATNKTMVLGAVQRGGDVRLKTDNRNANKAVVREFIKRNMVPGEKTLYTDDARFYTMPHSGETKHESVNHSKDEWVRGLAHTNTIEGVFSLFKRSIVGAYHNISAKHMDAYLDEFEFRFNRRNNSRLFEETIKQLAMADPLTFARLTKPPADQG